MHQLVKGLTFEDKQIIMFEDNQGAIFLANNHQVSQRTKHIDIRWHWIRQFTETKRIIIKYVHSDDNTSDICTKNQMMQHYKEHSRRMRTGLTPLWLKYKEAITNISELKESENVE